MDDDCYPSVMLAATAFRHQPNNNSNTAHSSSTHLQHSSNTTSITSNTSAQHPQQQPQSQQTHIQTHPPHQIHFPSKGHQATTTTAPPVHPVILVTSTAGSKPTISTTHLTINSSALMSTNSHTANLHHIHQQSSKQVNPVSNSRKPSSQYRHQHNENSSHSSDGDDIDVDDSNVKDEPLSPGSSCPASPTSSYDGDDQPDEEDEDGDLVAFSTAGELVYEHKNGSLQLSTSGARFKGTHHTSTSATYQTNSATASPTHVSIPKLNIKMEPQHTSAFGLPPTPPSSMSSDDSEGNQSPGHNESPMSPPSATKSGRRASSVHSNSSSPSTSSTRNAGGGYIGTSSRQPIHTPLISSQPKGSTGSLLLTEEEKRTLQAEGYPIPTRLPLTKAEEKSLKKIRRKIKNKISAQESRRKKKEYMDQLERKVEILVAERNNFQQTAITFQKRAESLELASQQTAKRVESLETTNATLTGQLAKYQALIKTLNKIKQ